MNEVVIRSGHLEGWFSEGVTIRGERGRPRLGRPAKYFLIDEPGKVHARADQDHPTGVMVCVPVELRRRRRAMAVRPCPCCHAAVCCNGHPR